MAKKELFLEIRSGAGGDEAAIFAGELARMYAKYAASKKWKVSIVDSSPGEQGGYKSLVLKIKGDGAYELLRNESGVHRVQRVPETEKSGRIHTSTASVAVLPVVEAKEIKINPSDLDVTFFRSSGPGGQNVNKVETAVRITHKPTGVTVSSQKERSQAANRESAMSMLNSKLYEAMREQKAEELSAIRKDQVGTADRSEKIRTYNFPQNRVADHRINKKWHKLDKIIEGDLGMVVKETSKIK